MQTEASKQEQVSVLHRTFC